MKLRNLFNPSFLRVAALGASLAAGTAAVPDTAQACGGLFCNTNNPVNQQAERIIFAKGKDGTVNAIIEIQYQGDAEKFAWMLPVEGSPEFQVSSTAALNALQAATNPQYNLNTVVEGECADDLRRNGGIQFGSTSNADASAGGAENQNAAKVSVLDGGTVGPYDFVIISVSPDVEDHADVAVEWLQMNGYDVNDFGADRLRPYLEGGMNLLAIRLTNGSDTGSIRPISLEFGSGNPTVPLRPTAVAANEDMGILIWVLGEKRAVPENYLHLELNEALINWFQANNTYNDVVIRAANEAGGQGFATEQAGETTDMEETIFPSWIRTEWAAASKVDDWNPGNRRDKLIQLMQNLGAYDGAMQVFESQVPIPDGVSSQEFFACPTCYLNENVDLSALDVETLISELQEVVVDPMVRTANLFEEHPYMTRLYTTMSPDEMDKDPAFHFNKDLGDYNNIHTRDRIIECNPLITRADAYWRVKFPGGTVRGQGQTWPIDASDEDLPANTLTRRIGTEGEGEIVSDNVGKIRAALKSNNAQYRSENSSGCSVHTGASSNAPAAALAALLALAFVRRRKGGRK